MKIKLGVRKKDYMLEHKLKTNSLRLHIHRKINDDYL